MFVVLRMDYMTLDSSCHRRSKRMNKSVMEHPSMREWAYCQSWKGHTDRSFVIAGHVRNDMMEAELVKKDCLNCFQELKIPRIDVAKKVIEQYLKLLAEKSEWI
jgi:hypothetical protein